MKFNLYQTKKQTRQFAIVLRLSGILLIFFIVLNGLLPVGGQIATGGSYTLEQAVVANGGGTSTGNTYSISGTTGQSVAGQMATTAPFFSH